ncbi:MAG: TPR end-of-group domain-containing protein [Planctomycetota bacterium]
MRARADITIVALLAALLLAVAASGQEAVPSAALERQIVAAFADAEYERAAGLIERYLEQSPNDPTMRYNLACAYSRMGEPDRAASALRRAVEAGFLDFEHMRRDPDLEAIRHHPLYTAIIEASERVAATSARSALDRWKATYGREDYRYEVDESRRLAYATALDEVSHRDMRSMLERQADHLLATLFESAPGYYVLIAVPTPKDASRLFNGDDSVGGIYQHAERRLIARDIGGTLRHEFVHLLHYGHMSRLGQLHPIWIQEGLASLFEDYEWTDDGSIRFVPNDRHNIVRNLAKAGRLTRWRDVLTMPPDRFMARSRVGRLYPQVRSMFEFLADTGQLDAWYSAYVAGFEEDTTGRAALESVYGDPLEEIEQRWRRWVRTRPAVDMQVRDGDAALGIRANLRGSNDGVTVARVLSRSAAAIAGLRRGDVIVAIDGRPTRNLKELRTIIGGREIGDRIVARVRRNGRYLVVPMTLRPLVAGI